MRGSDQVFRGIRNEQEPTHANLRTLRESSLGGIKKKAPPKRARLFSLMPGSDLLSHGMSHTTIGDASFHC